MSLNDERPTADCRSAGCGLSGRPVWLWCGRRCYRRRSRALDQRAFVQLRGSRRARLVADGGGLENRYGVEASSWVRIPRPPPRDLDRSVSTKTITEIADSV